MWGVGRGGWGVGWWMGWDGVGWVFRRRWMGFRGMEGMGWDGIGFEVDRGRCRGWGMRREYRETGDGMVTPLSLRVFRIRFQFCGDGLCNVKVDLGSFHDSSQSG